MKSLANDLLQVAEGVLLDYLRAYPTDEKDVIRDKTRLTLLIKERGLGVFTLDLPALDNQLLLALESGRLIVEGALSKKASATIQVPRLFRGLWLRIFDIGGNLREEVDTTAILFLRQLCCLGKKIEVECTPARRKATLEEYYNVELEIRNPTLSWSDDFLGSDDSIDACDLIDLCTDTVRSGEFDWGNERTPNTSSDQIRNLIRTLQRNADAFAHALGRYEPYEFSSYIASNSQGIGLRHGPGSVADLTGKEYKYDFPTWSAKLAVSFPFNEFGYCRFGRIVSYPSGYEQGYQFSLPYFEGNGTPPISMVDPHSYTSIRPCAIQGVSERMGTSELRSFFGDLSPEDEQSQPTRSEPPARLHAVPKTAKAPRLIASEPTAHQWCQQLTMTFLEDRLAGLFGENFISLRRQDLSQELVQQASLKRHLTTVDLSSASDRLSCYVIERIFRKNKSLLRALHAHRTRWMVIKGITDDGPNFIKLKKFASQGTAVTFPIQTIVFFLCAITASGFVAKGPEDFICNKFFCKELGRLSNKVRVYGDDIICPVSGYAKLVMLLHTLGLKVNETKSFHLGRFRESCGMDCFDGDNVTPIKTASYASTGPQSRQSLIDYSNNLFKIGMWNAAAVVESRLPGWVRNHLPVIGLGCGGVGRISFCGTDIRHLRSRVSSRYQRVEVRSYVITSRTRRKATNTMSALLQYYAEAPSPLTRWVHGVADRPKTSDGLKWEFPYYA